MSEEQARCETKSTQQRVLEKKIKEANSGMRVASPSVLLSLNEAMLLNIELQSAQQEIERLKEREQKLTSALLTYTEDTGLHARTTLYKLGVSIND